jgi:hypothetical protein
MQPFRIQKAMTGFQFLPIIDEAWYCMGSTSLDMRRRHQLVQNPAMHAVAVVTPRPLGQQALFLEVADGFHIPARARARPLICMAKPFVQTRG